MRSRTFRRVFVTCENVQTTRTHLHGESWRKLPRRATHVGQRRLTATSTTAQSVTTPALRPALRPPSRHCALELVVGLCYVTMARVSTSRALNSHVLTTRLKIIELLGRQLSIRHHSGVKAEIAAPEQSGTFCASQSDVGENKYSGE